MYFMTFYIDCAERTCRTQIFARTAADAPFFENGRNQQRCLVSCNAADHLYSSGRAVSRAVAAGYSVSIHYAVVINDYGMAYPD